MAKRLKIGDIVEIETKKGLAYIQYVYHHDEPPRYGRLIRVLPGFFDKTPASFSELVKQKERFVTFCPIVQAVNKGYMHIVGNEPVSEEFNKLPLFRARGGIDTDGKVVSWWLWDGEKEWKIGNLTPEQRKLPIREVINDTLLIERIESGWKPEETC